MKRKKRTGTRPNVEELLEPLKGFQRNTVEYVFERMYKAKQPATRFLVADEVGLGKTMIARGIIAKAIDDMWDRVGRIDIVYICSNVAIAKQNLQKLVVGEAANHALATRLTLLPRNLEGLDTHKLNFVSFTPGTSFDLKSRGGMVSERVVLHTLLSGVMDPTAGVRNLLQGNVEQSTWLRELRREAEVDLDPTLAKAFRKAYRDKSQQDLRRRLREAIDMFGRYRDKWPREHRRVRNRIIGDLRMLLARTSVEKLEPDLIILDEFQRFRHLLRGSNEMASLARSMWNYVTPEGDRARVLLLSATPYRMYSTDFENAEDDHYRDFIDTTRFLMNDDEGRVRPFVADLRRYRNAIHAALHGDTNKIVAARDAVQGRLRDVMVRTERVAETTNRDAMMMETRTPAELQASDLQQWVFLDKLSRELNDRDPIELLSASKLFDGTAIELIDVSVSGAPPLPGNRPETPRWKRQRASRYPRSVSIARPSATSSTSASPTEVERIRHASRISRRVSGPSASSSTSSTRSLGRGARTSGASTVASTSASASAAPGPARRHSSSGPADAAARCSIVIISRSPLRRRYKLESPHACSSLLPRSACPARACPPLRA